jgi:hypothetical protein
MEREQHNAQLVHIGLEVIGLADDAQLIVANVH